MDFEIRLVLGPFFKAILHCCKLRGEKYENTQYDLFSKFAGALSGKKYDFSDRSSQTRISNLINCTRWPRLLDSDIEKTVKQHFVSRLKAMRGFLNEYCDTDRLNETVAILKVLLENDDTISKDEELFISNVPEAGKCVMTTADEILKAKEFDFALFLLSLSCYVWDLENKDGRETVDEGHWKIITDPDVLAPYLADMNDLENGVPLVYPSRIIGKKQDKKGLNPCLTDMDFNALQSQVKDNPNLAGLVNSTLRNRNIYVETDIYRDTLAKILNKNIVMLSGPAGSGKTRTSEMVALKMAVLGYSVSFLYGTEGVNELFSVLSKNRNAAKRFILIDDCMGQAYFELTETGSATPLQNLISYVRLFPNRYRLLLNSRANIIEAAMDQKIGRDIISQLRDDGCFVNADVLSLKERAMILRNHLVCRTDREHYQDVGNNNYICLQIIHHEPFLPRVIDHVTERYSLGVIRKSGDYAERILNVLDNPRAVWDEIYYRSSPAAKALLMALYSLTETSCEEYRCREVFNRLLDVHEVNVDYQDLWVAAVSELNESFITLRINDNKRSICFYDPSVRDYLRESVYTDSHSQSELRNCLIYTGQVTYIYKMEEKEAVFENLAKEGRLSELVFQDEIFRVRTVVYYATKTGTLREEYKELFHTFAAIRHEFFLYATKHSPFISNYLILNALLEKPEVSGFYYGQGLSEDLVTKLLSVIEIEEACYLIPIILKHHEAFAFDFDEFHMMNLMATAVKNSMSRDTFLLHEMCPVLGEYYDIEVVNKYIHDGLVDYCRSVLIEEGYELTDEIRSYFLELIEDAPIDDYSDEIECIWEQQYSNAEAAANEYLRNCDSDISDEEILAMFREPFPK